MSKYIDITFPVSSQLPVWPGSIGFAHRWHMRIEEGKINNLSSFTIDSHLGTHIDAPLHFVANGKTISDLDLNILIGEVYVAEIQGKQCITADDLGNLEMPVDCKRLLLKTDNQVYWERGETEFQKDFCSIDISGAEWLVEKGIKLIGIDYLSIQRFL